MKSEYMVLFDIDGTLLNTEKLHTQTYEAVFSELLGVEEIKNWPDFSGRTELWLIRKLAELNGISSDIITARLPEIIRSMGEYYKSHLDEEIGHLTPGIEKLIHELDRRNILRGIVTGNIQQIANLKLQYFGIEKGFRLGKYGSEHEDRTILLRRARSEALRKFPNLSYQNIIYVGDTPLDIETSHEAGIRSLAVKTNPDHQFSFETVKPGLVIDTLENLPQFFEFLYQSEKINNKS